MTLSPSELAYSQQKNREYIWLECKDKSREKFGYIDEDFCDFEYERLCKLANITAW
jgi:hypothetical protein